MTTTISQCIRAEALHARKLAQHRPGRGARGVGVACGFYTLLLSSTALTVLPSTVHAADDTAQAQSESPTAVQEVVVTVRKRTETLMNAPLTVEAVTTAQLSRNPNSDLQDLMEMLPNVTTIAGGSGSLGAYNIRGIGGTNGGDDGVDQSITLVLDDVPIARGTAASAAYFDLASIQVLPGPQALFVGKNADGGVIALTSASPTDHFEAYAKAGYEFVARERYVEGAVSGPLSSTFRLRFALRADKSDGWLKDVAGPLINPLESTPAMQLQPGAADSRLGGASHLAGRLTAIWAPTPHFTATLKAMLNNMDGGDISGNIEVICPPGQTHPHVFNITDPYGDCRINGVTSIGALNPEVAKYFPNARNGVGYSRSYGGVGSLKLEYNTDLVTLTSVTGYYNQRTYGLGDYSYTTINYFPGFAGANDEQLSEELRFNTHLNGPVNILGGFYVDNANRQGYTEGRGLLYGYLPGVNTSDVEAGSTVTLPTDLGWWNQNTGSVDTYSGFAQGIWHVLPNLELDAGARFTEIRGHSDSYNRYLDPFYLSLFAGAATGTPCNATGLPASSACLFVPPGVHAVYNYSEDNWSPEVTLNWHPTPDILLYGSYKTGYKPGGVSNPSVLLESNLAGTGLTFGAETAAGGEIGMKGQFLDHTLQVIASIYDYDYTGLQLNEFNSATTSFFIRNAGAAITRGAEVQASYRATPELTLDTTIDYNDGFYSDYKNAACYVGQTAALGCLPVTNASGAVVGTAQDLTGKPLPTAPKWVVLAGLSWDHPLSDSVKLGVDFDGKYSSSYAWSVDGSPVGVFGSYFKLNARVRVYNADDKWEIAFIGRNLTNTLIPLEGTNQPGTGNAQDGFAAEYSVVVDRGRELGLQVTGRW